jgi:tetratricopeptide (TPR) repeat protein
VVLVALLGACAQIPGRAQPAPPPVAGEPAVAKGESELLMAGEMSLRNGDCREASENYAAAALVSKEIGVAARASQIAIGCNQLETAQSATARWRELDPWNGQAALAAALVALKLYDLDKAREALTAWRDSGSAGSQDPLAFAESLSEEADATALYRVFTDVLVSENPAPEVLLAQARLAFAAQNMQAARSAAQRALEIDPDMMEARSIDLRALSVLGDHDAAIAGARQLPAGSLDGTDNFLLADLLDAAGRDLEARKELERLAMLPDTRLGAQQRLIGMALRTGDLDGAQEQLEPLLAERGDSALAVLYFAQLAERRGDDVRAVQSYQLLIDSPLGLTARLAAGELMVKHGDIQSAVALLDEYAGQNPQAALDVGISRATLLADAGELKSALAGLDALDQQYPGYPGLQYARAAVLETGGRTSDAVAQFEKALKQRPQDPELQNALGFTLADHKLQLKHAEEQIRTALAVSPDNPAIQDSLGWVLYRRGKKAQALPVLARAWQNSGDAEIAAHYGEVLWKSGDEGKARYIWEQALNANPQHVHLRDTMQRLTGEDVAPR